eukprot:Platyproteum_vivax@DN12513_c0_g1_i1.p1
MVFGIFDAGKLMFQVFKKFHPVFIIMFLANYGVSLSVGSISIILSKELGLSQFPAQIALFYSTEFLPSMFKVAYAAASDLLPIQKLSHFAHTPPMLLSLYRRCIMIVLFQAVTAVGYLLFQRLVHSVTSLYLVAVPIALFFCISEAAVDGVVASLASSPCDPSNHMENAAAVQSLSQCTRQFSTIGATASGVLMLLFLSPRGVLVCVANAFMVSAVIAALLVPHMPLPPWPNRDPLINPNSNATAAITPFKGLLSVGILAFSLYIVPNSSNIWDIYMLNFFDLSGSALYVVLLSGSLGGVLGCFLFPFILPSDSTFDSQHIAKISVFALCVSTLSTVSRALVLPQALAFLHIPPTHIGAKMLLVLNSSFVGVCQRLALLPVLVFASLSAPRFLEGTAFAGVVSLSNIASACSGYFSAGLLNTFAVSSTTQWVSLQEYVLVCAAIQFCVLLLM